MVSRSGSLTTSLNLMKMLFLIHSLSGSHNCVVHDINIVSPLWFQHAKELMQAAQNRGGNTFCFKTDTARIERCLEDAVKDNNFIYHDKIPDVKSLQPVGKAPVAKALPLNSPMSERFTGRVDNWSVKQAALLCLYTLKIQAFLVPSKCLWC